MQTNTIDIANADALDAIEIARESAEPVAFITGNAFMPPLRGFGHAEDVWHADNTGDQWEIYCEVFEAALEAANVMSACPEYDNAVYVVDLARWSYVEDAEGDSLNDEWVAVS